MGRLVRIMRKVQPVVLVTLPVIMMLWAWLKLSGAAVVTTVCACVALVPFFAGFEKSRRRARDLMPIVILTALAVGSHFFEAWLDRRHPGQPSSITFTWVPFLPRTTGLST